MSYQPGAFGIQKQNTEYLILSYQPGGFGIQKQNTGYLILSYQPGAFGIQKQNTGYLTAALGILLFFLFICGPMNNLGVYK